MAWLRALGIPCPACGAKAHHQCKWFAWGIVMQVHPVHMPHKARIEQVEANDRAEAQRIATARKSAPACAVDRGTGSIDYMGNIGIA